MKKLTPGDAALDTPKANFARFALSDRRFMEDAGLRARWRDLVDNRLPARARDFGRAWPVSQNHCFARILLDAVCGRPWRETIAAPAWRRASSEQLRAAIELGERVLEGEADLFVLIEASLRLWGRTHFRRG